MLILPNSGRGSVGLLINVILTASSVALFCYWFRYGCLLILAAEAPHDYSEEVASAHSLSFPEVRAALGRQDVTDLGFLHTCLERDFVIIMSLLEDTPRASFDIGFEDAMLKIHYGAMSAWFRLTRGNVHEFSTEALEEMSLVVAHFANAMGERRAATD